MSLKTRYNLFKIKRSLSPSTVFKAGLQKELNKAWDEKYGKVSWFHNGVMYRVGAMAVAVLVLVGSGGAYAYNSPDVTEGNILYPVKKAIEKVEEVTRITPEAKAKFLLKKIERREAEREGLNRKKVELRKAEQERLSKNNDVESEQDDTVSANTVNATELESKILFIQKDEVVDRRIEKLNKSIQATEDSLEKFNENFNTDELKNVKLEEEVKDKIEKRLEKRKMKLEKTFEIMKSRNKVLEEVKNKGIEIREDKSGSRDLPRLEKIDEQDGN